MTFAYGGFFIKWLLMEAKHMPYGDDFKGGSIGNMFLQGEGDKEKEAGHARITTPPRPV